MVINSINNTEAWISNLSLYHFFKSCSISLSSFFWALIICFCNNSFSFAIFFNFSIKTCLSTTLSEQIFFSDPFSFLLTSLSTDLLSCLDRLGSSIFSSDSFFSGRLLIFYINWEASFFFGFSLFFENSSFKNWFLSSSNLFSSLNFKISWAWDSTILHFNLNSLSIVFRS